MRGGQEREEGGRDGEHKSGAERGHHKRGR